MKRIAFAAVLALLLAALPLLGGCAQRPLILYTDLSAKDAAQLVAPFTDKTGLKVQVMTFSSADALINAIAAPRDRYDGDPSQSGQPTATPNPNPADVVLTGDMLALTELADRDGLESYMSQSVADLPYGANGGGYWYGFGGKGWVVAWNTQLAAKKPDGFQDLANSAYPLKSVVVPNPEQYAFYPLAIYSVMGESYAINIFQNLLLNDAALNGSPEAAANGIANGTYQVGVTTYELAKKLKDAGKPIDFVFPDQGQTDMGAYVQFYSVGVVKGSPSLKEAKKLDDWLLSTDVEALSVQLGLSDVTLRDVGGAAPVIKPLVVSTTDVMASEQPASDAFSRLAQSVGN